MIIIFDNSIYKKIENDELLYDGPPGKKLGSLNDTMTVLTFRDHWTKTDRSGTKWSDPIRIKEDFETSNRDRTKNINSPFQNEELKKTVENLSRQECFQKTFKPMKQSSDRIANQKASFKK